jgi:hypothetical protein
MKKSELKEVLRPLIRDVVKEVIMEEVGVLSHIISETVRACGGRTQTETSVQVNGKEMGRMVETVDDGAEARRQKLAETRRQLTEAVGKGGYAGIFDDVDPTPAPPPPGTSGAGPGPMADMDPHDPGVDISGLTALVGQTWDKLKEGK